MILSKECSTNSDVIDYISSEDSRVNKEGMAAYNYMNQQLLNSSVTAYVKRIIAVDNDYDKFIQVGSFSGASKPVTKFNINDIEKILENNQDMWINLDYDPYDLLSNTPSLPIVTEIKKEKTDEKIGTIVVLASTQIITDRFKEYTLEEGSKLFLDLKEGTFEIVGDNLILTENAYNIEEGTIEGNYSENTTVTYGTDYNNQSGIIISYPIRNNMSLTHFIPLRQLFIPESNMLILLTTIYLLILILIIITTYQLDKNISEPISRLKNRIDLISEGDFSFDETIESENELGQVGKGINRLSHEVVGLMNSKIEDENSKRLLEYRMLQNQINPHFLYNTLNSIKMMAVIQGADGIADMSTSLSKLLRTISKDMRTLVPLKDELELVDSYTTIQNYRYSDTITVVKEIEDEEFLNALIPRFSLQPLIENAIFHGIEPKGGGTIKIKVKYKNNNVHCTIQDDGIGISREAMKKILSDNTTEEGVFGSIGILNVEERLKHCFGNDYGIIIRSVVGEYTKMTIRLPFEGEKGGDL